MAFDAATNQLIMFGGSTFAASNQTWSYGADGWRQLHPSQSPGARQGASMAYDPDLKELVMFGGTSYAVGDESKAASLGGANSNLRLLDTWAWTGSTWIELANEIDGKPSPADANYEDGVMETNLTYDAADRELVLDYICTNDCIFHHTRTWGFDSSTKTWTRIVTPLALPWNQAGQSDNLPPALTDPHPTCNPSQNVGPSRVVAELPAGQLLYIGQGAHDIFPDDVPDISPVNHTLPETWTFADRVWRPQLGARLPNDANQLSYPVMAADVRGQMVLFAEYGETWLWNGLVWTEPSLDASPGTRCGEAMAYDPVLGVDVLYGGEARAGGMLADTWTWDGHSWTRAFGGNGAIMVVNPNPQSPPPVSGVPSTEAQVIASFQTGHPHEHVVGAKLVRSYQLVSFRASSTDPVAQPDRLFWVVLVRCQGWCIPPSFGNAAPPATSWGWTQFDAYQTTGCNGFPGCGTFAASSTYPAFWDSLPDLANSPGSSGTSVPWVFALYGSGGVAVVLAALAIWWLRNRRRQRTQ